MASKYIKFMIAQRILTIIDRNFDDVFTSIRDLIFHILFGWKARKIKDVNSIRRITSNAKFKSLSVYGDNEHPMGWCWAPQCIAHFTRWDDRTPEMWILCSNERFRALDSIQEMNFDIKTIQKSGERNDGPGSKNLRVVIFTDRNNLWLIESSSIIFDKKWPIQDLVISAIEAQLQSTSFGAFLFYGASGSGKSVTAILLAQRLGFIYVPSFNPSIIDNWGMMSLATYNKRRPGEGIVCVIDEVDAIFDLFPIEPKSSGGHPIVYDRKSWNDFMDFMQRGFFSGIIFILTSNKPRSYFDEDHSSEFRHGRINAKFDFDSLMKS